MTNAKNQLGRTREEMAKRLALDIPDGSYVNLGIGIPELVASFVPDDREVIYHTENGLLGMGPTPEEGDGDPELINADSGVPRDMGTLLGWSTLPQFSGFGD